MPDPPTQDSAVDLGRQVLDNLLEGCQVVDSEWRYVYVNDALVRHSRLSRQELLGRTMMECYPGIEESAMFAELRTCMELREHRSLENEFTFPDGQKGWFELRLFPVPAGVCILSLDMTDRKRAAEKLARTEDQLRHAQKMEAVGRLAGGVAHDFNNVLSAILTFADLVLEDLPATDPTRSDILEIRSAGQRGSELTRQLLAFSRHQILMPKLLELREVVTDLQPMLERLLGEDIDVALRISPSVASVTGDRGELEQVLMNLAVNARDAMPRGGKLTLELRNVELDEEYAEAHAEVTPGRYVMLAISDSGVGMKRETVARVFEPFFTTKAEGTGLGLSMVFGIVKRNRGHIWVYSEEGKGTTFKIYLPEAVKTAPKSEPQRPASDRPIPSGTETILLVEDDEAVRAAARGALVREGYRVLEAANAGEALLICDEHGDDIDLLLTDVVLPKMSGPALATRLAGACPRMRVLFMSGYTDEAVVLHGILESEAAYLQKPLTHGKLQRKVREALDQGVRPIVKID